MPDMVDRLNAALEGRYRVEGELGDGGMATVYEARDLRHDRRVAIKVLRPEIAAAVGAERFLAEIRTTANLRHPHILPLFDSGDADGLLYYVMPLVQGGTLRDRLERDGPLPIDDALRVLEEVAEALTYAHERGVVHRDVKPANILFDAGHALVADFGIARALNAASDDRLTKTGFAIGTPTYMSPEQATGEEEAGSASDTYSLACIGYEMLGGRPPFDGRTPRAVLSRHAIETPRPVRERRPEVPPGVDRALLTGLAKDAADRPDSATGLAVAMREANAATAIAAEARRGRRNRLGRAVLGGLVLAGLGGGIWWLSVGLGGPRIERLAVLPLANITGDTDRQFLVQGVHEALINELDRAGITAIARQSVMQYADSDVPIREIASTLGVDAVIEGSVAPSGDSVSISARLIDGRTEETIWSGTFDGDLSNVVGLYRQVTRQIADQIRISLTPAQKARLAEPQDVDPEAYLAYLRGMTHLQLFDPVNLDAALSYFEQAIEIDPEFARAYLGVARTWGFRAQAQLVGPAEAGIHRDSALARALAIDSTLAEAYMVRAGGAAWVDWDWQEGVRLFKRTLELDPEPAVEAEARLFYSHLLTILGRWAEADEQAEAGRALDPSNVFIQGLFGVQRMLTRREEEAEATFEDLIRRNRGAAFGRVPLADRYLRTGREDEGVRLWLQDLRGRGFEDAATALEEGSREGGAAEGFRRAGDALSGPAGDGQIGADLVWGLYARAGRAEKMLEWLEISFDRRGQGMPYIGVAPYLEPFHGLPRFREVVERLGLRIFTAPIGESGGAPQATMP